MEELSELIDTLWNVNTSLFGISNLITRINRYIMECKCDFSCLGDDIFTELIDTLWNVNQAKHTPLWA